MEVQMKTVAAFLLCATFLGFSPQVRASGDGVPDDNSPEWGVLNHTIQEALTGGQLGPYSAKIAPQAQLAIGDSLLDLPAVFASGRGDLLRGDQNRPPVSICRKMNAEKNAAFLLFATQRESKTRYHTVVFMKDSTGTWMVESWQVSH
jgi:hypothetical protein